MNFFKLVLATSWIIFASVSAVVSESKLIDDFRSNPEQRWQFIADTVMGGVSKGAVRFETEDGNSYAHLTGSVSTANNGGFIQIRRQLNAAPSGSAKGVRLVVRGNNQRYFVHLRTSGTILPWQYYKASFEASKDWQEISLLFSDFQRSSKLLREAAKPTNVRSVAIVAFGRDYQADVQIGEIGLY